MWYNKIKLFKTRSAFKYFFYYISLYTSCSNSVDSVIPEPPAEINQYSYSIINTFPHQQDAFTQGLTYSEGFLWESTGLYGQSTLRRVDLESGTVLQKINLKSQLSVEKSKK